MPRSSLPTPATLERATLNRYARTTAQLFFSMQHSSRQSYATCHVLVQYYKISFRRQASADASAGLTMVQVVHMHQGL